MFIALRSVADGVVATSLDDDGTRARMSVIRPEELTAWVAARESDRPRWVWNDTTRWYPELLAAGVRVDRALDLRLCRRILRSAEVVRGSALQQAPADAYDRPAPVIAPSDALFELDPPPTDPDPVAELRRQRATVDAAARPGALHLLLAAESVGALAAAEMHAAGLPWDRAGHEALLEEILGARPVGGGRPSRMEAVLAELRAALDDPEIDPDSPVKLLAHLQRAGLPVRSTRSWELQEVDHPAIAPLLEYKKLARLLSANGWTWLDQWVHRGRFRPSYVPGGVVTGRWASDGGGALQLPKQVRGAVVADPGWTFVVADAAQLEPRILAAISGDAAMAAAGRAQDMYEGMVASGAVETRQQAKYGMLGAIYGGTTGESGRMRPRITRTFPTAMAYVEAAARTGEEGRVVSTWLGRSSPAGAAAGYDETASADQQRRARGDAAAWGRFTRNFVVQGSAAEWALCWIGALRRRLWELGADPDPEAPLTARPHLVFFLHDELIVHTPRDLAPQVADALRAAAEEAGRLLFGRSPVEFALSVATVDRYADAK